MNFVSGSGIWAVLKERRVASRNAEPHPALHAAQKLCTTVQYTDAEQDGGAVGLFVALLGWGAVTLISLGFEFVSAVHHIAEGAQA